MRCVMCVADSGSIRRLSMSADCLFAADFTSSLTGHDDDLYVKSQDESRLTMSVEALSRDDLVDVVRDVTVLH